MVTKMNSVLTDPANIVPYQNIRRKSLKRSEFKAYSNIATTGNERYIVHPYFVAEYCNIRQTHTPIHTPMLL